MWHCAKCVISVRNHCPNILCCQYMCVRALGWFQTAAFGSSTTVNIMIWVTVEPWVEECLQFHPTGNVRDNKSEPHLLQYPSWWCCWEAEMCSSLQNRDEKRWWSLKTTPQGQRWTVRQALLPLQSNYGSICGVWGGGEIEQSKNMILM